MEVLASVQVTQPPWELADVDVAPGGGFVAITGVAERRTIAPGIEQTLFHEQKLLFSQQSPFNIPVQCRFPTIRALGPDAAVVVDDAGGAKVNGWIVARDGQVAASFYAGNGIEDVIVCGERIAITYFDQGIFSFDPPSPEGVAVFDLRGVFDYGYHTQFGRDLGEISDCYAACADEESRLLICPYTDFPIVRIDLAGRSREVFPTPGVVHGAGALSAAGDRVFLWSPYERRNEVFEFRLGGEDAAPRGLHAGPLRGLPGGRFLFREPSGYSVLSAID